MVVIRQQKGLQHYLAKWPDEERRRHGHQNPVLLDHEYWKGSAESEVVAANV